MHTMLRETAADIVTAPSVRVAIMLNARPDLIQEKAGEGVEPRRNVVIGGRGKRRGVVEKKNQGRTVMKGEG